MSKVRVRIAPSPTGKLHIGTARTALFNFLFAKNKGGTFILRFEDTDRSRSTKEFEEEISESLKWLGLNWDEDPYFQMERLSLYKKISEELEKKGFAYKKEGALWLDVKKVIDQFKIPFKLVKVYSENDGEKGSKEGYLIELPGKDLILGKISANVEDFVILRSNEIPTYHFAVVVDDEDMKISHVIRGQDHFSNTPKHYLLQKALGYNIPDYAHIPLTLSPDRAKLSKRYGAVSISEYRAMGYLPEALINFMALLGWAPKDGQEIVSLDKLIKDFDIADMNKSPAIFDIEKLNSLNGHYIRALDISELTNRILEVSKVSGDRAYLEKIVSILQTRMTRLDEFPELTDYFFKEPKYKSELLIFKKSTKEKTITGLIKASESIEKFDQRTLGLMFERKIGNKPRDKNPLIAEKLNYLDQINVVLSTTAENNNLSPGDVFWPVRVALSGHEASPSPGELLWVLGKEESLKRINKALKYLG